MVILLILMDSIKDVEAGAVTLCRSKTPRGGDFVLLAAVFPANSRGRPTLMSLQMALLVMPCFLQMAVKCLAERCVWARAGWEGFI